MCAGYRACLYPVICPVLILPFPLYFALFHSILSYYIIVFLDSIDDKGALKMLADARDSGISLSARSTGTEKIYRKLNIAGKVELWTACD